MKLYELKKGDRFRIPEAATANPEEVYIFRRHDGMCCNFIRESDQEIAFAYGYLPVEKVEPVMLNDQNDLENVLNNIS